MPHRRLAPPIDWRLTQKLRQAVREGRVITGPHPQAKLEAMGLDETHLLHALRTGVVLPRRRRDEQRTAIDGYKHFLSGVAPNGIILEVVFKFVVSERTGQEEVVVILTLYGGRL